MKYLKLYLPVIMLIIFWLLFYFFKKVDFFVYLIALGSLFTMIYCSIKNEDSFKNCFIMLIIYNIVNVILAHFLDKNISGLFIEGIEDIGIIMIFIGTSILYFIIMSIQSLSDEKKEDTK
ncbi:MAG: hypothetical protein IJL76_01580 [Bacilli bacterium]|nr:hypothetical protein [Bacilli bacterium]